MHLLYNQYYAKSSKLHRFSLVVLSRHLAFRFMTPSCQVAYNKYNYYFVKSYIQDQMGTGLWSSQLATTDT